MDYSPWGHKELDMTEQLNHSVCFHVTLFIPPTLFFCCPHVNKSVLCVSSFCAKSLQMMVEIGRGGSTGGPQRYCRAFFPHQTTTIK